MIKYWWNIVYFKRIEAARIKTWKMNFIIRTMLDTTDVCLRHFIISLWSLSNKQWFHKNLRLIKPAHTVSDFSKTTENQKLFEKAEKNIWEMMMLQSVIRECLALVHSCRHSAELAAVSAHIHEFHHVSYQESPMHWRINLQERVIYNL